MGDLVLSSARVAGEGSASSAQVASLKAQLADHERKLAETEAVARAAVTQAAEAVGTATRAAEGLAGLQLAREELQVGMDELRFSHHERGQEVAVFSARLETVAAQCEAATTASGAEAALEVEVGLSARLTDKCTRITVLAFTIHGVPHFG